MRIIDPKIVRNDPIGLIQQFHILDKAESDVETDFQDLSGPDDPEADRVTGSGAFLKQILIEFRAIDIGHFIFKLI